MIFNITLKAAELRELNGVGRFFNLLSSSTGKVRIRALDSDAREIISTEILNGDAIEFERLVAKLYVMASEDAAAVLYFSQHKLVNNGVTVKAPGQLKASVKFVDGIVKLNSVSGQNQEIEVKSDLPLLLTGPDKNISEGWPLNAGAVKKMKVSGDVYAYRPAVRLDLVQGNDGVQVLTAANSAGANGIIYGNNSELLLHAVGVTSNNSAKIIKNGVHSSVPTTLNISTGSGTLTASRDNFRFDFVNGFFYILCSSASGVHAILRTADFQEFEQLAVKDTEDGSLDLNYGVAVSFAINKAGTLACITSSSQASPAISTFWIVNLGSNTWVKHQRQVSGSSQFVAGTFSDFYWFTTGSFCYRISENGIDVISSLPGNSFTGRADRMLQPYNEKAVILRRDGLVIVSKDEVIFKAAPGGFDYDSGNLKVLGNFAYIAVGGTIYRVDLLTGQRVSKTRSGVGVADNNPQHLNIIKDGAQNVLIYNLMTAGLIKENLITVSGSVTPAVVNVLETF
ncbi:MAG: hypothetical protein ACK4GU_13450 [Alishewanella aestuarii]